MCNLPKEVIFLDANEWKKTVESLQRVNKVANEIIAHNAYRARTVNEEESKRFLYSIEMAQFILRALDSE